MSQPILTEDRQHIRTLTLNLPDKLNALSMDMLQGLSVAFDALEEDRDKIRVVILKGAGKAFCVGHNLSEMTSHCQDDAAGRVFLTELFELCSQVMLRIHTLPQPVIAQVHGIATAAGCQLVATCDLAVAADTARFGVNGVNIGLFCSTPMVALTRNIPRKQAFEMLTTGEFIGADRAMNLGLINHVAPDAGLDGATQDLAQIIAGKLSSAVRIGKRAFYEQIRLNLPEAYACTGQVMVENMMDKDTGEGIAAFLEKRAPEWQSN